MGLFDFFKKKPKSSDKEEKPFEGSWDSEALDHDEAQAKQVADEQHHVVQEGESLSKIAEKYYGKASQWQLIYDANQDQINDPDLIKPGQRLYIPEAEG